MKTLLTITLAITFSVLSFTEGYAQFNKKIVGNSTVTTKTVTTSDYDVINVAGSMDVKLEKGTEGTIVVSTDENLHNYLIIESENGTLTIKIKNQVTLKTKKGIKITVPFKDISKLSLSGSGDVLSKDVINSNSFEVSLSGSGDINLDLDANNIDAKLTGSGDLELSGKTQYFEIKVSGSGNFKGSSLSSQNTQVYISGSGDAKVNATKSLKARVNGSGDIRYSGNPEISDTKVMGSGSIKSI